MTGLQMTFVPRSRPPLPLADNSHTVKLLLYPFEEVGLVYISHQAAKNRGLQTFTAFLLFLVMHRNIIQNINNYFEGACSKGLGMGVF